MHEADEHTTCPDCGRRVPVLAGYPTWCDSCGWNLGPAERPSAVERSGRVGLAVGRRAGARLARELTTAEALEPRLTVSRIATYAIAAFVVLLAVGLVASGVVFIVYGFSSGNVGAIVLGALFLGVGIFMRPRVGKPPAEDLVSRADAPTLFALADRVADALAVRPITDLVVDDDWNASWAILGLRRRRVLRLGLPLLAALEPQQRVAIVAHELAHARNGDSTRGLVVSSSVNGLAELYSFLSPDGPEDADGITLLAKPLLWVISRPPYWLLRLQIAIALHDSHRAEYLADDLAAQVAGTDSVVQMEERLLLTSAFEIAVHRAAQPSASREDLFADIAAAVASVPPREIERQRRVAELTESRLDRPHPPLAMRIDLLERRPRREPGVCLSPSDSQAIDEELRPMRQKLERRLVQEYRSGLYEG